MVMFSFRKYIKRPYKIRKYVLLHNSDHARLSYAENSLLKPLQIPKYLGHNIKLPKFQERFSQPWRADTVRPFQGYTYIL